MRHVISRILSPAESYDLVERDIVRQELKLTTTDSDTWLSRAIAQASAAIASYCHRIFQIQQYEDLFYSPGGGHWEVRSGLLKLSRSPLANYTVRPLSLDAAAGDTVLNLTDSDGILEETIVSGPGVALGSTVVTNLANQVTLSAPLTAAIASGVGIAFGIEVKETNPDRGLSADIDYKADVEAGQLLRLNENFGPALSWRCGAWPLTVTYYAGYETIPPDIEEAAVRLVTMRWHARGRDPMLRERSQESGQRESFWVGPTSRQSGAELPDEIEGLIKPYRRLEMVV